MILVLIGQTASGKTTIKDILVEKMRFLPIITYTTRPKRKGERDRIDYNFITKTEFDAMDKMGMFAETTEYDASFGHCKYGSALEDYRAASGETYDAVVVLNPDGAKMLKSIADEYNLDVCLCYIDVPMDELVVRALARGDDSEEVNRRLIADSQKFWSVRDIVDVSVSWAEGDSKIDMASKVHDAVMSWIEYA